MVGRSPTTDGAKATPECAICAPVVLNRSSYPADHNRRSASRKPDERRHAPSELVTGRAHRAAGLRRARFNGGHNQNSPHIKMGSARAAPVRRGRRAALGISGRRGLDRRPGPRPHRRPHDQGPAAHADGKGAVPARGAGVPRRALQRRHGRGTARRGRRPRHHQPPGEPGRRRWPAGLPPRPLGDRGEPFAPVSCSGRTPAGSAALTGPWPPSATGTPPAAAQEIPHDQHEYDPPSVLGMRSPYKSPIVQAP